MENRDKILIQYKKWGKAHTIAWIVLGVLFFVTKILTIINEFVDLTSLAYTVFTWLSTVLSMVDLILIIICYVKIRKYRKLINQNKENENKKSVDTERE